MAQQRTDKIVLYSRHAPEAVCIAKGKAHKPYEFGCKVAIAATNRDGLFLAAQAFEGNPHDGHTLAADSSKEFVRFKQIERRTGLNVFVADP